MILKIISVDDEQTRLQLVERITFEDFDGRLDPLVKLFGETVYKTKLLLDMSGSEYIDSSGVGWLVATNKKFCNAGGCLAIHSFQPEVKKTFAILRMEFVLNLCEDEAAANAVVAAK